MTGLNPTKVPITFIHSTKITVDYIKFDKTYAGNQKLVTQFRNVEHVAFQGLHVDEAIEVKQASYENDIKGWYKAVCHFWPPL